jgi:hypothetical protein
MAVTSKKVASKAAKSMKKDLSRKDEKSIAASALRQAKRRRK